jgi:hypothetical protein
MPGVSEFREGEVFHSPSVSRLVGPPQVGRSSCGVCPPVRRAIALPHTPRHPQSPDRQSPVRLRWLCTGSRSLPQRWQPSPSLCRVGFHIKIFGACSAFTARCSLRARGVTYVTLSIEGFSRFVTSTTAPIATGWSDVAGWVCLPLGDRAFPRRTQGDLPRCGDAASDGGLGRPANRRMLRLGSSATTILDTRSPQPLWRELRSPRAGSRNTASSYAV